MTIYLKTIVLRPNSIARRVWHLPAELRHTSGEVTMFEARLLAPFFWMNFHLVLGDDEPIVAVNVPGWSRRKVRAELIQAGISVHRVKT